MITATVDSQAVMANLAKLEEKEPKATEYSAEDVANEILRLSQFEVPHDEGTLQNSGTVEREGDTFVVGYHTPYAARLHEHPEYRFQGGRKGKYLEDPIKNNLRVLGLMFKDAYGQELF